MSRVRCAVLASGSGTNLQALLDAARDPGYPAEIAVVVSDNADAYALTRARAAGVPAVHIPKRVTKGALPPWVSPAGDAPDPRDDNERIRVAKGALPPGVSPAGDAPHVRVDTNRRDRDAAMVRVLRDHGVEWVCLAGYMRLVTSTFLDAFPWRVLNVHPALLPAFPGLHAQEQALRAGVRITGCTLHFVDEGTDTGPIIAQAAVPVLPGDDLRALSDRILQREHELYPQVLSWAAEGRIQVVDRRVQLDLPRGASASLLP